MLKLIFLFICIATTCLDIDIAITNQGKKIGYVKNGQCHIDTDTVALKKQWQDLLQVPDVNLEKIEVYRGETFGDRQEEYFMVIAFDKSKALKTVRWLLKQGDSLYFYKTEGSLKPEDVFYKTYFTLYGSDTDCFPEVYYSKGHYQWVGSKNLECDPNSPCKSITQFLPFAE